MSQTVAEREWQALERRVKQRVVACQAAPLLSVTQRPGLSVSAAPLRDTTSPPDDLSPDEPGGRATERDQVVHFRSRAVGLSPKPPTKTEAATAREAAAAKPTKQRPPPNTTHRSSFAQRFFADLLAGELSAFSHNGPQRVTVLQDVGGPIASWRPKHQLPSK